MVWSMKIVLQQSRKWTLLGGLLTSVAAAELNDTGTIWGANFPAGNQTTCQGEQIAAQDCSSGRDRQSGRSEEGEAGFSYTKLAAEGTRLAATATEWACVRDEVTGLVWEGKRDDGSIHDKDHRYRWGGEGSLLPQGSEFGSRFSDWNPLLEGSNRDQLCGFSDWRIPTRGELLSLINGNQLNPAIDSHWFPYTEAVGYWSANPNANYSDYAWYVNFYYGNAYYHYRSYDLAVRLVRGGQPSATGGR